METKHTPGPWKIAGETADKQSFVYALNESGTNQFWFDIQPGRTDDNQRTSDAELAANARLIAAAPELLEALCEATAWLHAHKHTLCAQSICDQVDAAIAKATGQ